MPQIVRLLRLGDFAGMLFRMPRERLTRTILLEETKPFSATVETLDLHELGAAFSALFDQTAQRVFRQGLDLDDVIVERLLDCRRKDGATVRVPLPSLCDRAVIVHAVREACGAGERGGRVVAPTEICAIVAQVLLDHTDSMNPSADKMGR